MGAMASVGNVPEVATPMAAVGITAEGTRAATRVGDIPAEGIVAAATAAGAVGIEGRRFPIYG